MSAIDHDCELSRTDARILSLYKETVAGHADRGQQGRCGNTEEKGCLERLGWF